MRTIILAILFICTLQGKAQQSFEKYFTDKVLRVDFMFSGNSKKTIVYPAGMKEEPYWGGSKVNLTDAFNTGNFKYEVFDSEDKTLIYSKGFCTLFQEWQTTAEAKTIDRSFYEVATMPFPKHKIRFVISVRERDGKFSELYETIIDPSDYYIRREKTIQVSTSKLYGEGASDKSVDLAFIAEGYKQDQMDKFREDVRKMTQALFAEQPFSEYKDKFNIWAVEAQSQESGTDVPGENIYVNTALNSSFYTFGTERYLTTQDIKTVNDYAAVVPHDNIIVLINSSRYGGGGVYNYYSGTTAGNLLQRNNCRACPLRNSFCS